MIELFGEIVTLMGRSDIHRTWAIEDLERLIAPALVSRQFVELREGGQLVGFGTYAFLTDEAGQGYVDQTRKIEAGDWNAGENIWVVDAIAPFGHGEQLGRKLQAVLLDKGHKGREVRFIRSKGGARRVSGVVL